MLISLKAYGPTGSEFRGLGSLHCIVRMEEIVPAAETNRDVSRILRDGRSYVVTAHEKPVVRIPCGEANIARIALDTSILIYPESVNGEDRRTVGLILTRSWWRSQPRPAADICYRKTCRTASSGAASRPETRSGQALRRSARLA